MDYFSVIISKYTKDELKEILSSDKSKLQKLKILKIPLNRNGAWCNNLLDLLSEYAGCESPKSNFEILELKKKNSKNYYDKHPKLCLHCGNPIPFEKRYNKACSRSCACSLGNKKKGPTSKETREKISKGVNLALKEGRFIPHNQYTKYSNYYNFYSNIRNENKIKNTQQYNKEKSPLKIINSNFITLKEALQLGILENHYNYDIEKFYDKLISKNTCKERECKICNKQFKPSITKIGNISKSLCCSEKCHKTLLSINGKATYQKVKAEGRFKGWQSRNITSYPEKFWQTVLDNNNIQFKREVHALSKYFLDFVIEKNNKIIDLEIDGKQHTYPDRIESDKERDKLLTENGYIVYRIPWHGCSNQEGKTKTYESIQKFLEFYNSL